MGLNAEESITPVHKIHDTVDSFIVRWHFILNVTDKRHSHLGRVVTAKDVAHKVCFDLHLHLKYRESAGQTIYVRDGEVLPSPMHL